VCIRLGDTRVRYSPHSLCPQPGSDRDSAATAAVLGSSVMLNAFLKKAKTIGSFVFQQSTAGVRTLFPWVWKRLYILSVSLVQRKQACTINSYIYAT